MTEGTATTPDAAPANGQIFRTLLTAAWMAIVLGLLVQIAVLAAKLITGGKVPQVQLMIDIAGGVTWSVIVCSAVAIGTAAARSVERSMTILGLLGAPVAFSAAKVLQRGIGHIVGQPVEALGPAVYETGAAKTIEYALLGLVLGLIIRHNKSTLMRHVLIGLGFGVVFAIAFVAILLVNAAPGTAVPTPKLAGTAINELIFPIGCSMVLFWVTHIQLKAGK